MVKESKMVIVWRNDLKVRKGKIAAQVAHASLKIILDAMTNKVETKYTCEVFPKKYIQYEKTLYFQDNSVLDNWINGIFTKVVVKVNSESELMGIYNKALVESCKSNNLLTTLIVDKGLTEFHGVSTITCCAILGWKDDVDEITGDLELL